MKKNNSNSALGKPDSSTAVSHQITGEDFTDLSLWSGKPETKLSNFEIWQHPVNDMINLKDC